MSCKKLQENARGTCIDCISVLALDIANCEHNFLLLVFLVENNLEEVITVNWLPHYFSSHQTNLYNIILRSHTKKG